MVLLTKPKPDAAPDLSAAFDQTDQAATIDRFAAPPAWHGFDTIEAMLV